MRSASDAPYYFFDPKLGDQSARYLPTAVARSKFGRPEMPAVFVATVEGQTFISSMWGSRPVAWRAEPGTPCVILGYWSDDTVRLRWPAIHGAYRVDGRFPSWVVDETPNAAMAGGGHILKANDPPIRLGPVRRLASFIAHVLGGLHAS